MPVIPKSRQIELTLRNYIYSGRWNAGDCLPKEEDLLAEFQVSRTTLRHAMSALVSDGLLNRVSGHGTYVSDSVAAGQIAFLARVEGLASPVGYYHRQLIQEIAGFCEDSDYRIEIAVAYGRTVEDLIASTRLLNNESTKRTIGVIADMSLDRIQDIFESQNIKSVAIEYGIASSWNSVVLDMERLFEMAVALLYDRGYDDFAIMHIDYSESPQALTESRMHEYLTECYTRAVRGKQDRLIPVPWSFDYKDAYVIFKEWFKRSDRPKAIFFADDALFDVASAAILELGIRVPEDLAIVTHTNVNRQFRFPTPVHAIGFDPEVTVREAWQMLQGLISGDLVGCNVRRIEPVYIEGESL